MARLAGTLRPLHDGIQSLQPLVSAWNLQARFRPFGIEITRQSVFDRQHRRESSPRGKWGKRGEKNQAIGISRGGRTTKIHAIVDSKGRPLSFTVTGGQVHDSQVVEEILNTPRAPLAVTADKAYDSEKVRQQIRDDGALPVIPNRCSATKKAYCPSASIGGGTKSRTSSAASKIGGVSPPATTSSRAITLPPPRSSRHSTGSN